MGLNINQTTGIETLKVDQIATRSTAPIDIINKLNITDATAASSTITGSIVTAGGVGIAGDLWVGGTIHGNSVAYITVGDGITSIGDYNAVAGALTQAFWTPIVTAAAASYKRIYIKNGNYTIATASVDFSGLPATNNLIIEGAGAGTIIDVSVGSALLSGNECILQTIKLRANAGSITLLDVTGTFNIITNMFFDDNVVANSTDITGTSIVSNIFSTCISKTDITNLP
jgi:hypothetical protein